MGEKASGRETTEWERQRVSLLRDGTTRADSERVGTREHEKNERVRETTSERDKVEREERTYEHVREFL